MEIQQRIKAFLAGNAFAVIGASADRTKYGNKVLRAYMQQGRKVFPVNPKQTQIEGLPCYAELASLPEPVHGVSIVTPPAVTERMVEQVAAAGIEHVWLQPGAESRTAVEKAEQLGLSIIAGGPCALVALHYRE